MFGIKVGLIIEFKLFQFILFTDMYILLKNNKEENEAKMTSLEKELKELKTENLDYLNQSKKQNKVSVLFILTSAVNRYIVIKFKKFLNQRKI